MTKCKCATKIYQVFYITPHPKGLRFFMSVATDLTLTLKRVKLSTRYKISENEIMELYDCPTRFHLKYKKRVEK